MESPTNISLSVLAPPVSDWTSACDDGKISTWAKADAIAKQLATTKDFPIHMSVPGCLQRPASSILGSSTISSLLYSVYCWLGDVFPERQEGSYLGQRPRYLLDLRKPTQDGGRHDCELLICLSFNGPWTPNGLRRTCTCFIRSKTGVQCILV